MDKKEEIERIFDEIFIEISELQGGAEDDLDELDPHSYSYHEEIRDLVRRNADAAASFRRKMTTLRKQLLAQFT